jgi:hypothetical protein
MDKNIESILAAVNFVKDRLACACDVLGAAAIGEQAVMADAVEAVGQHMDEEAADELYVQPPSAAGIRNPSHKHCRVTIR